MATLDIKRCKTAYSLMLAGMSAEKIGKELGICGRRVSIMLQTYEQYLLEIEAIEDLRKYRNGEDLS